MPGHGDLAGRMLGQLRVRDRPLRQMRAAGARAGAVRPRGSSSRSRRASVPSRSARAGRERAPSARAGARAGRPARPRSRAAATTPTRQSSSRRSPKRSQAPDATSASSAPLLTGARRARSATSAYGCPVRRPPWPPPRRPSGRSRARRDRTVLVRASGGAQVDVGRQHLHPVPLPVADETGRRVEAHRLRVQQRAEELGRVVVAQPRRLVGEQRERG